MKQITVNIHIDAGAHNSHIKVETLIFIALRGIALIYSPIYKWKFLVYNNEKCELVRGRVVRRQSTRWRCWQREETRMMTMRLVRWWWGEVWSRRVTGVPGIMVKLRFVLWRCHIRSWCWGGHGELVVRHGGRLVVSVWSHWEEVWWWRRRWCWRVEWWRVSSGVITIITHHTNCILAMDLQMLPQWRRMSVGFVASSYSACVGFVCGMNMHVLLTITGVSKPSVTSFHLTLKWFLS